MTSESCKTWNICKINLIDIFRVRAMRTGGEIYIEKVKFNSKYMTYSHLRSTFISSVKYFIVAIFVLSRRSDF